MLVTLTMNPALDVTADVDEVRPNHKLRLHSTRRDAGGGGVNVAKVAHVLETPVRAIFPCGGASGDIVGRLLDAAGVPIDPVQISEPTRQGMSVNELTSSDQYSFALPGPVLTDPEQVECLQRLREHAPDADLVVASGSLPPSVPDDFYQRVADICAEFGVRLIVDTSGEGLNRLRAGVFLIKPSLRELREFCGDELPTQDDQVAAARAMVVSGRARHVLVSKGGDGALLVDAESALRFPAVPVTSGSGVGAGDAMVAGVAVGVMRGQQLAEAVRLGIACGAAALLTPGSSSCTHADVRRLLAHTASGVEV